MIKIPYNVRRPTGAEWGRILEILEMANFHRIGGREMPVFPLEDCFVADADGRVVGVAGYRILDDITAKTTLLVVDPAYRGRSIGEALQKARQTYLREQGIRTLYTNVDDERVLRWYVRRFGYRPTGERVAKTEPFGRSDRTAWITLTVDL